MEPKLEGYLRLCNKVETEVFKDFRILWEVERNSDHNAFTITAYAIKGGNIVLTQNWHNGNGISIFLPDGEMTFAGSRKKIEALTLGTLYDKEKK